MLLLFPGNPKGLLQALGVLDPKVYGLLLSPRRTATKSGLRGLKYGVDNGCFTGAFEPLHFKRILARLKRAHIVEDCLFVVAPDVVYHPRSTLIRFDVWEPIIHGMGFPVALAGQDGLEDLEIPWDSMDALFIGGSTEWKLSETAADLIREAKRRGLWTHIGRVNSVYRASRLREMPDSIDGTAWAKHPTEYTLQWQRWHDVGRPSFVRALC